MFSDIKRLKERKKYRQQDLEKGWDDRFYLYKIQDYSPVSRKPRKVYNLKSTQKNSNNISGMRHGYNGMYNSVNKENDNANISISTKMECPAVEIESDVVDLWNDLGVTQKYRMMFANKMLYFNDGIHSSIIDYERNSLRKIHDLIVKITNELVNRKKILKEIDKDIIMFQNEKNVNINDKILNEIKQKLKILQNTSANIYIYVSNLRKSMAFDITNGKFDLKKINSSYIFESNFLLKLNMELSFIRDSQVGTLLNLQNNFDPFISEIDEGNKSIVESNYVLLNELIYTNVSLGKQYSNYTKNLHKLRKINNSTKKVKREYVNADTKLKRNYDNVVTKEELEKTFNDVDKKLNIDTSSKNQKSNKESGHNLKKSLSAPKIDSEKKSRVQNQNNDNNNSNTSGKFSDLPEVDGNYINDNDTAIKNLPKLKDSKQSSSKEISQQKSENNSVTLSFYTEDLLYLSKQYNIYHKKIPQKQFITFHVLSDINEYINTSTNPIVITSYNDKKEISSLVILSYVQEENNSLCIKHISSPKVGLKEFMDSLISFIKQNIPYQHLYIDLYYENENGKLTLDKDINLLFKELKFQWVKLENLENGIRYQKLKLKNDSCMTSESRNQQSLINIQSGLVIYCKDNVTSNDNNDDTYKEINLLHLQVCEKVFKKSIEKVNKITSLFCPLKFLNSKKVDDIKKLLDKENIKLQIDKEDNNQIYASLFNINSSFDSFSTVKINSKQYIRLRGKIEILKHKDTEQIFYMIVSNDSHPFLICEMNQKFKAYMNSDDNGTNIYEKFYSIYPQLESCENDKNIYSIYIPKIRKEVKTQSNDILNSKIDNISKIYNYAKLSIGDSTYDEKKSLKISPNNETDIILSNDLFFSIINIELLNEFNIPCVFCSIISS